MSNTNTPQCIVKWKYKVISGKDSKEMAKYQNYVESQTKDLHSGKKDYQDFQKYVDTKFGIDREHELEQYQNYMEYRKGSGGMFSDVDADVSALKKEMRDREGIFWIPIVSMKAKDAELTGMDSEAKWQNQTREYVHQVAKLMGIKNEDLRWVAAFHVKPEKDQNPLADAGEMPHVHVVIWDASGKTPARLNRKTFKEMRKIEENCYLGEWKRSLYSSRNELREEMKSQFLSKAMVSSSSDICGLVHDIAVTCGGKGKLSATSLEKYQRQLEQIQERKIAHQELTNGQEGLLKKFRIKNDNDLKKKIKNFNDINNRIDKILDDTLNTPEIKSILDEWEKVSIAMRGNSTEELATKQTMKDLEQIKIAMKNSILNYAKDELDQSQYMGEPSEKQMKIFREKLTFGKFNKDTINDPLKLEEDLLILAEAANHMHIPLKDASRLLIEAVGRSGATANPIKIRQIVEEAYENKYGLMEHTTGELWGSMKDMGYAQSHPIDLIGSWAQHKQWQATTAATCQLLSKTIFDIDENKILRNEAMFYEELNRQKDELIADWDTLTQPAEEFVQTTAAKTK